MKVTVVPCLADNFAYLAFDETTSTAVIVDPSEVEPIVHALRELKLKPAAVLCTHHHGDHVGGVPGLMDAFPDIVVWAHEQNSGRIAGLTNTIRGGEEIVCQSLRFRATHVPGHTLGDIAWCIEDAVFTGDTLFAGGCGRVFEGTPAMMYASLDNLATLPRETKIYCGHNYTLSNLRFAEHVEPSNTRISERRSNIESAQSQGFAPKPTTIGEELLTNPFLRCTQPEVVQFAQRRDGSGLDPVSVFASIRAAKNQFRG